MLFAVKQTGVTEHPKLYFPSTIGTKMNLVLLLVFGQLRCQCSFESFCNFTQYSIIIEGIFSIIDYIEQNKYKKVDYKTYFV